MLLGHALVLGFCKLKVPEHSWRVAVCCDCLAFSPFLWAATSLLVLKNGEKQQSSSKVGQIDSFMLEVPYEKSIVEQQGQSRKAEALTGLSLLIH